MAGSSNSFSLPLTLVFSLLLASCGGGGSSSDDTVTPDAGEDTETPTDTDSPTDSDTDDGVGDVTDIGSAALSCTGTSQSQDIWAANFDAPDFEVFDDVFVPDFDTTPSTPQERATFSAPSNAGAAFISIQLAPLYFQFELAACTYEVYAENQCQAPFLNVDSASMNNGALAFTRTLDDATVAITISDSLYTSGTLQRIDEDGTTSNMSWSRDADGTERFSSFSGEGLSTEFIEYPDCSGIASSVLTSSDGEPPATMSGEWISPTGTPFAATFEWCDTVEGVVQCDTFTRP